MGALDTSALKSLWDQSDPNAIYLAEENKTGAGRVGRHS